MKPIHLELSMDTKIASIGVREDLQMCVWSWNKKVQQYEFADVTITLARRTFLARRAQPVHPQGTPCLVKHAKGYK